MSSQSKNDLSIVILSFNAQFWLKKNLSTLKEFYLDKSKKKIEVMVVDNASSDDSVAMIKKEFKWVKLVVLPENIGFAAGNNVALKQLNSKYVMLINNDIEFTPDSNLDLLVNFMENNRRVGVVTPKILLSNGKLDLACHRGEPTPGTSLAYFLKLDHLFPTNAKLNRYHLLSENLDETHQIDACSGAAMLVRSSVIKQVGLLDERFFMYGEDLDWCKRIRDFGNQVVFYPKVTLTHHKYKSGIKGNSINTSAKTQNYFYNTMLQYYDKHYRHTNPEIYRTFLKIILFIKKGGL